MHRRQRSECFFVVIYKKKTMILSVFPTTLGSCGYLFFIFSDSPVRIYNLGVDTVHTIKCNPIETDVMVGCSSDRSIFLLDTRQKFPLKKVITFTYASRNVAFVFFHLIVHLVQGYMERFPEKREGLGNGRGWSFCSRKFRLFSRISLPFGLFQYRSWYR